MSKLKNNLIPLSLLLTIPFCNMFYALLNNSTRGVHTLMTSIDQSVPFIRQFILPYSFWYPFLIITMVYLCINDRKAYYKTIISLDIGLLVAYIIFFFFQTTVPRPELIGNDVFTKIITFVYAADAPYNCFPSIHVLTSYLMIKGICWSAVRNKWNQFIIIFIGTLIIISTQFIKQHILLDVVSGILLAELVFRSVCLVDEEKVILWIKTVFTMKKKLENP